MERPTGLEKQVSKIGKYHNHTLQTNPRHHQEEPQIVAIHMLDNNSKATSFLFRFKIIAKLECTQSNA